MAEQKIKVYVLVTFYDETGLHKAGSVTEVFESEFNSYYMKKIEGGGGSTVEVDQIVSTGTKIATITVDSDATDIYAPEGSGGGSEIDNISTDGSDRVSSMDIDGTGYQFTSVDNISTDGPNSEVSQMSINGSGYSFATGTGNASISNISQTSKGKIESFDLTIPDGTASAEFVSLLEDLEDVDITGISDGEVLTYQNGGWTYSAPTKIENISETGGVVDSMDIDGATYNFATGGGGGGSSLVVTLTGAYQGVTIDLATMSANSSISVSASKTYAEIKAADDIIFKIVDTTQAGSKYVLRPTGMQTLNVSADQSLFYTFSVITPSSDTPKVFKLEIGPWGTNTFKCIS